MGKSLVDYEKEVNWRMRRAKVEHFSNMCHDSGSKPRKIWQQRNTVLERKIRSCVTSLMCENGTLTKATDIVNEFSRHFRESITPPPASWAWPALREKREVGCHAYTRICSTARKPAAPIRLQYLNSWAWHGGRRTTPNCFRSSECSSVFSVN